MNPAKRLKIFALVLAGVLTSGTVGFALFEKMHFADALYLTVVTVATVGYGDIVPITAAGKFLAVIIMLTGVSTFLGVVAGATELLLERRQEQLRKERLCMVIEIFLTEIGVTLLRHFVASDKSDPPCLAVGQEWDAKKFQAAKGCVAAHKFTVSSQTLDLGAMRDFLDSKLAILLRILENPNLGDHEDFTEMLRAVFHLKAELSSRGDLSALPETDINHLVGDINRAYTALSGVWLDHMLYLKGHYPYLFSFSARTNPFVKDASPVVLK